MSRTTWTMPVPAELVWAALTDPYTYPDWLVGAKEMRAVDDDWPQTGSAFHHRVGVFGPLTVSDNSRIIEIHPPRHLALEVKARPLGRGRVDFLLTPGEGTTELELHEVPLGHLRRLQPLLDPVTTARNKRSLHQLAEFLSARAASEAMTDRGANRPASPGRDDT
jgi:uncharacterized protein YndB with AHSA1/START domain